MLHFFLFLYSVAFPRKNLIPAVNATMTGINLTVGTIQDKRL